MNNKILLLLMSAIGLGLSLNPVTNKLKPELVKGLFWLLSGSLWKLNN